MTTAADLIAALLPRKAAPLLERQTGLPHGWGLWLRHLPEKLGHIPREKAHAFVDVYLRRPPATRPRAPEPSRWQALRALFYQTWDPPPREERGLRWFARIFSIALHLLFAAGLLILAMIQIRPPPAEEDTQGVRTRIEFIGEGTPQEEGGGAPVEAPSEAAAGSRAAPSEPASSAPAPAAPASAVANETPVAQPETPVDMSAPQPSPPVEAEQDLQLTETPQPTHDFVLPPPTVRNVQPVPAPRMPQLTVPTREVTVVETPVMQPRVRPRAAPELRQSLPQVREREIEARPDVSQLRAPTLAGPPVATPELRPSETRVREIEVPVRADISGSSATTTAQTGTASNKNAETDAATSTGASRTTPAASAPAASGQGSQATANTEGPARADQSGARSSPRRADDWGDSTRNTPGQDNAGQGRTPGLFNADGSVKLGEDVVGKTTTQPGPPGSRAQQAYDADRANKWLERAEYPYEPTMFDKYWKPRESLLAEWVRKGIKIVEVAIPGTSKKVQCTVSILQLGGGCALNDPNLNNQPATARPPPEIPQKRNPVPTDS